jgi:hypothetical protein
VPPRAICCIRLSGDPEPEDLRLEQVRVEQRRLPLSLSPPQPVRERSERQDAEPDDEPNEFASLLPHEDAEHDAAHPDDGEDRADGVDTTGPGVRHVPHEPDAGQNDRDDGVLEQKGDAPRQIGGDESSEQWSNRGCNRSGGPHECICLLLGRSLEVAVDERLHGRQQERRADPTDDRPEDDDRDQVLRECHCQSADGVAEQPQHVCALAPEEVAYLAPDQDERRRDQCLQRDCRLDAADGRVEISNHRRDGDIHQGRVHDEDEHRHRQQDGEALIAPGVDRRGGGQFLGHGNAARVRDVLLSESPPRRSPSR